MFSIKKDILETVLKIENLSKQYRLGEIGTGTFSHDLNRFWAKIRGKEDPFSMVGQVNDRSQKATSNLVWALKDINFEVEQGEVLGVIGKNGAGKSTLLKLISRITSPTTGFIKVKGRIASLLEVGTGMHPEMTARENIYLNGAIMGMTKMEITKKFDEIIEFSGCAMYVDTPVKRYSSGMRVRLGFAVAAFLEPEILIVDEVLAVGDAEFQKKAIGKMKDVSSSEGRTVLFVSHNMASIQHLCTKTLVLKNGTTAFKGSVEEGIQFYMTNNIELSKSSLSERTDRTKGKNFRFTSIEIKNALGLTSSQLVSGEDIVVHITYKLDTTIIPIGLRLLFVDSKGSIRMLMNSGLVNRTPSVFNPTKEGKLTCAVPRFPLPKGDYTIQLSCFSNAGVEDDIEQAISFDVIGGDFYNTGKEAQVTEGVLVDYNFEFKI